jgi:glycosyltransferase involved in cell wall biosynthesis
MGTWSRDRMVDAYEAADAFALLSLDEGFGLVYVEALAAGLPCVVHANDNTAFILGELAYRGDVSTPAGAARLLENALKEQTSDALRSRRLAWVRERFGWESLAPRYAEMMRACATGRRPMWSER